MSTVANSDSAERHLRRVLRPALQPVIAVANSDSAERCLAEWMVSGIPVLGVRRLTSLFRSGLETASTLF